MVSEYHKLPTLVALGGIAWDYQAVVETLRSITHWTRSSEVINSIPIKEICKVLFIAKKDHPITKIIADVELAYGPKVGITGNES